MEKKQDELTQLETWAELELLGHQSLIGFVRVVYFGVQPLLHVVQPERPASHEVLTEATWIAWEETTGTRGAYLPAGAKVEYYRDRLDCFVSFNALYKLTPLSEHEAMRKLPVNCRPTVLPASEHTIPF